VALQDNIRAWLPTAAPLSVAEVLQPRRASRLSGRPAVDPDRTGRRRHGRLYRLAPRRRAPGRPCCWTVAQLRTLAQQAQPLIPRLVEQQRQRFIERWNEALGAVEGSPPADVARDRALTEATAYAIRIDVAEELTRLASHLGEIERLLDHGAEVGKRLDFLIQELHREANTLGSKSSSLELTRISVDMKVLIEQMREQVQNIE
jgi:uncharacterized protein (TIGR00255 family)